MGFFSDITGGSLLSGLGSLFGGYMGYKAVKDTNKTNMEIATQTNNMNRENQIYQNEWNLGMWNQQNAYNDPSQQRKRLENAGLNPLFYGLDGTGNAGSLTSADFTAVPGSPMSNGGEFLANGISNAMNSIADYQLKMAQKDNIQEGTKAQQLQNYLMGKTADNVIELSNITVKRAQNGAVLDEKAAAEADARINQINATVQNMNDSFSLMVRQFDFEKEKFDFEKELRDRLAKIEEGKLDNETKRLAYDISIGWYKAYQDDKRIELDMELNGAVVAGLEIDNYIKSETKGDNIYRIRNEASSSYYRKKADSWLPIMAEEQVYTEGARRDNLSASTEGQQNTNSTYYFDNMVNNAVSIAGLLRGSVSKK